ncbi:uncharacterized protein [Primulina eburnea]|uniref:uncharacterized protein n=1 Tax=Primulina eburnea TaxID=1245227 RepID=UPI003C6BDAE7
MNSSSDLSSLSDNEDDITNYLVNDAEAIDKEIQGAVVSHIHTPNMMMHAYINQQVNEGTRRGSISCHVVIRRDREIADRNLFNDYFSENPIFHEVVEGFANQYFLSPNANDVARLLHIGKQRGFSGILGSLDCMHWKWKNCPTAWAGQYTGRSGSPIIILEAVADMIFGYGMRIFPIYHPKWSTIMQTIRDTLGPKKRYFLMKQETCKKDVERAFGVLQSRFAIVASPARPWRKNDLHYIMKSCIIMHNMIIEDERDLGAPIEDAMEAPTPDVEMVVNEENDRFQEFLFRYKKIKNRDAHYELRNTLIEHLGEQYSSSNI